MVELVDVIEVPSAEQSRRWKARVKTPQGMKDVQLFLSGRELNSTPPGNRSIERPFTEDEVRAALALTVERQLVGGGTFEEELKVSCFDLYRAAGEVC
jgi:hypothetical protein